VPDVTMASSVTVVRCRVPSTFRPITLADVQAIIQPKPRTRSCNSAYDMFGDLAGLVSAITRCVCAVGSSARAKHRFRQFSSRPQTTWEISLPRDKSTKSEKSFDHTIPRSTDPRQYHQLFDEGGTARRNRGVRVAHQARDVRMREISVAGTTNRIGLPENISRVPLPFGHAYWFSSSIGGQGRPCIQRNALSPHKIRSFCDPLSTLVLNTNIQTVYNRSSLERARISQIRRSDILRTPCSNAARVLAKTIVDCLYVLCQHYVDKDRSCDFVAGGKERYAECMRVLVRQ